MTTEKHWSHKSNEKEPGNPLSRIGENYRTYRYRADQIMFLEARLCELLAVIDRQEEEKSPQRAPNEGEAFEWLWKLVDPIRGEEKLEISAITLRVLLSFFYGLKDDARRHDSLRAQLAAAEERERNALIWGYKRGVWDGSGAYGRANCTAFPSEIDKAVIDYLATQSAALPDNGGI